MNNTPDTKALIAQLKSLLQGGNAHATFEDAVKGVPAKMRGVVPEHLPYSLWQVVEHLRLAQWDIVDFCRNPKYKPMKWPADYWPKEKAPKDAAAWTDSLKQIKKDTKEFIALLEKKSPSQPPPGGGDADLYTPFAWGQGQNLLREALLIADHNSYHTGEIIVIRRVLGIWK